jgi:hypothetical protein
MSLSSSAGVRAGHIGWPIPRWGLAIGLSFLLLMTTGMGVLVGYLVAMTAVFVALPAISFAGEANGAIATGVGAAVLALALLGGQLFAVLRAPTREARAVALNALVLTICVFGGLVVAVLAMQRSWM